MRTHHVKVFPLPGWLSWQQLLGAPGFRVSVHGAAGELCAEADLPREEAADLSARLRGLGFGGERLVVEIAPPLPRAAQRRALTDEARRRRAGSPGFLRPNVRLDAEARRSLTPEALALRLGERAHCARVLDACCGAGGNAIGFARAGCTVTAIDIDPERLALARWNARIYGATARIQFVCGDARALAAEHPADLLFVDPPWGERYDKQRVVLADLPLLQSMLELRSRFPELWAKVPPSFVPASVPGARAEAFFGVGEGDARRVKFLLLTVARQA